MTYRERREARAARRREWSEKRTQKAEAAREAAHAIADTIPMGQPILVGHHSEARARRDRDRIWNGIGKSVEHSEMAKRHEQAADTIESQLERSIYDDDPDAVERLRERIAVLEAQRERIKALNAALRRGKAATADDILRIGAEHGFSAGDLRGALDWLRFMDRVGVPLTNLTANIARNRERLVRLEAGTASAA